MGKKTLRIATCNLQTGIGTTRGYWQYLTTGWKYFLPHGSAPVEKAAVFLQEEAIDVAALCEAEGGSKRTKGVDQVALLSEHTSLRQHVFFPTLVTGARINQGNAVCAQLPLQQVENHALSGSGEPRFLSEAALQFDGTPLRLFVTHLSLERKVRRPQIQDIMEIVNQGSMPTLLTGDFNISEEAELKLLLDSPLQQVNSRPTFPAWRPKKRLDHLFVSDHFTILDSWAFDRFLFSDHLPLVAEIQLRNI